MEYFYFNLDGFFSFDLKIPQIRLLAQLDGKNPEKNTVVSDCTLIATFKDGETTERKISFSIQANIYSDLGIETPRESIAYEGLDFEVPIFSEEFMGNNPRVEAIAVDDSGEPSEGRSPQFRVLYADACKVRGLEAPKGPLKRNNFLGTNPYLFSVAGLYYLRLSDSGYELI